MRGVVPRRLDRTPANTAQQNSDLIGTMIRCPLSVGCKMAGYDMGLSELQVNQRLGGEAGYDSF